MRSFLLEQTYLNRLQVRQVIQTAIWQTVTEMLTLMKFNTALLLCLQAVFGLAYDSKPYAAAVQARQASNGSNSSKPMVDLGYEIYQGYSNSTSGLNIFRGYAI